MPARLGLFGGTFNPVHTGHLILAQRAFEALALDRLHLLPSARPPHKAAPDLLPAEERAHLLELAFTGIPGVVVDRREIERPPPSYTVDTVRSFREDVPDARLLFVVGSDQARGLGHWRDADLLARELEFAVHGRRPERENEIDEAPPRAPNGTPFRLVTIPGGEMDLSSTEIRERLAAGLGVRGFVPDAVAERLVARRAFRKD